MEKGIIWYLLQLKSWGREKRSWLLGAGMLLVLYVLTNLSFPTVTNTAIGICNEDSVYGTELLEKLQKEERVFTFQSYDSREALERDVENGALECGFVLKEGLTQKLQKKEKQNLIDCITTPFTTKGYAVQETIFAALFQIHSRFLLEEEAETLFENREEELLAFLQEKNAEYLQGNQVFQMKVVRVDAVDTREISQSATCPVTGIVGILLFLTILLKGSEMGEEPLYYAMSRGNRMLFRITGYLASVTVESVIGMVFIMGMKENRGFGRELLAMMALIAASMVWALVIQGILQKNNHVLDMALTLLLAQLVVCPIFADVSRFVPAVRVLRLLFPVGIYLVL